MGRLGLGRLGRLRLGLGRLRLLELLGWVLVGSDFEEGAGTVVSLAGPQPPLIGVLTDSESAQTRRFNCCDAASESSVHPTAAGRPRSLRGDRTAPVPAQPR